MSASPPPMALALAEAEAAAARGEVPVGAVLVDGAGQVLAAAGNRVEADHDPTAHAEMLVLARRCANCSGPRAWPDAICGSRSNLARCAPRRSPWPACGGFISRAYDPKGGAVEHGPRLFDQPTIHHRPEIYGGIDERRAEELLQRIFPQPARHASDEIGRGGGKAE